MAFTLKGKQIKNGGGIMVYVRSNLMYKIRKDLSVSDADREDISIEIVNKESKNYIISCCYRPPRRNINKFSAFLDKSLQRSNSDKKGVFVLGEFNLNCLNYKMMETFGIFTIMFFKMVLFL